MAEKALQCNVNGLDCRGKAEYVCHHCGRPLCSGHGCCKWGWDPAFAGWPIAHHCPSCDHIHGIGKWMRVFINWTNQLFERKNINEVES